MGDDVRLLRDGRFRSRGSGVILDALDAARRWTLSRMVRTPALRPIVVRRDARMFVRTTVGIVFAFGATLFAPGLLFVLGPIAFGVPHVASDLRYLVRRAVPAQVATLMYAGCATLLAVRALELAAPMNSPFARIELALAAAWVAAAAASARAPRHWTAGVLVALALLLALAWPDAGLARLIFAHVHNLVGIVIWLALFRRKRAPVAAPLALLAAALLTLASGATVPLVVRMRTFDTLGIGLQTVTAWLAPSVGTPAAEGLTLAYVFLQSVHYMVWLVWIPDDAVRTEGTPTFRMTARGLARDFTLLGMAALAAASALVALGALVDVHRARMAYLSLATFHGYLELAVLAYLSLQRLPRKAASRALTLDKSF